MNEKIYDMLNELADKAGCPAEKEAYNEVRTMMQESSIKQYAILGDANSGKSTIINALAGEKILPATVMANEHDNVAFVESGEHQCRWVELALEAYAGGKTADVKSPLWFMDAAVYVFSATAPFSQQDVDAIRACIAHGVPCSLVVGKIDVVDEAERSEVISYVRAQAERFFGTDSVIIINARDTEATKQAILGEFAAAEDSRDIREYMLAVSYARVLKENISKKYEEAKKNMQAVTNKEAKTKQDILNKKIAWDGIALEIESRKMKLIEDMSVEMNRLYSECIAHLTDSAMKAKSPKDWWEKSLEEEFGREITSISNQIDRMICYRVAGDRDWLVHTVEEKFGSQLSIDTSSTKAQLESAMFGLAPEKLNSVSKGKNIAIAGLAVSSVALCAVLTYPVITMHAVNILSWAVAGVAVAGTGFWTFMETKKDLGEKQECLKSEIARYILGSRDDNIEILKKNIEYGYDNMNISIQDLEMATTKAPASKDDKKTYEDFKTLSDLNRNCDEIVNSLLSEAK